MYVCGRGVRVGRVSLASQTFTRKTGRSGDISIPAAVPVARTECKFCCIINRDFLLVHYLHILRTSILVFTRELECSLECT